MVIGKLNIHHFSNYVTREKKSLPLGDACPPKSLRPIKKKTCVPLDPQLCLLHDLLYFY